MCVFVLLFVFVCLAVCLLSSLSYSQFQGEASKQMFYQRGFARLSLFLSFFFVSLFDVFSEFFPLIFGCFLLVFHAEVGGMVTLKELYLTVTQGYLFVPNTCVRFT